MKRLDAKGFRSAIADLKLTQESAGVFFGYSKRTGQRWAAGESPIPLAVQYSIQMMIDQGIKPGHIIQSYRDALPRPKEAQP